MNKIHRFFFLSFILLMIGMGLNAQTALETGMHNINKKSAREYIGVLASDSLNGRKTGTEYARKAANYIVEQLQRIGVKPLNGNYLYEYDDVKIRYYVRKEKKVIPQETTISVQNVMAVIPGIDIGEYVLIGAHYDHLGSGGFRVTATDSIFNGANDNASGVAGVLQIAEAFVKSGKQPLRTVIFAFWDAEERGLLGSQKFVDTCEYIDKIKAHINLDMIARGELNHSIFACLEDDGKFAERMKADVNLYNINLDMLYKVGKLPPNSDHAPFAKKGIPVAYFFTGADPDYHSVSDEFDKLNWNKTVEITKAAYLTLWHMANEIVLDSGRRK